MNTLATAPLLALALIGLSTTSSAQVYKVLPLNYTKTEGPTSSAYPFGYQHTRTQQVWHGPALSKSVAIINGLWYRRDTGIKSAYKARTFQRVSLRVGSTTVSPGKMSTTYASNITSSMTTVLSGTLNLPAQPTPTQSPAVFNAGLNWKTPFLLDVSKGNLLFDMNLPGPVGKNGYFVDAAQVTGGSAGVALQFGKGGAFAGPEIYALRGNASAMRPGGAVDITCGLFKKAYTGSLGLGISRTKWNALNLPFDLRAIGATNNSLYVSLDFQVPFTARRTGTNFVSSFRTAIPNSSAFAGITFYAQGWYADRTANAAGLVATNALALTTANPSSTPLTNMVGHYDTTKTVGFKVMGSTRFGGPVVRFFGIFP